MTIIFVKKCLEDAQIILDWRNNLETRKMFYNSEIQTIENFKKIFYEKYFSNKVPPLFYLYKGVKVAFIGFKDIDNNNVDISINIDPKYRNMGLGTKILNETIIFLKKKKYDIDNIIAEIKIENKPSIKIFTKNNFYFYKKKQFKNKFVFIYIFNMSNNQFIINNTLIGQNYPTYFIAELSCNHNQDKNIALKLIDEAHKSGANAIKLQTYTPDTMTLNCDRPEFTECLVGSIWEGQTLYDLYSKAYTPWEWHKELKEYASDLCLRPWLTNTCIF